MKFTRLALSVIAVVLFGSNVANSEPTYFYRPKPALIESSAGPSQPGFGPFSFSYTDSSGIGFPQTHADQLNILPTRNGGSENVQFRFQDADTLGLAINVGTGEITGPMPIGDHVISVVADDLGTETSAIFNLSGAIDCGLRQLRSSGAEWGASAAVEGNPRACIFTSPWGRVGGVPSATQYTMAATAGEAWCLMVSNNKGRMIGTPRTGSGTRTERIGATLQLVTTSSVLHDVTCQLH